MALQRRTSRRDYLAYEMGNWSLIDMGKRPMVVKEWYLSMLNTAERAESRLKPSATNANHCARIIRALYRRARAADHRLPPVDPIASIGKKEWHKERKKKAKALAPKAMTTWYE